MNEFTRSVLNTDTLSENRNWVLKKNSLKFIKTSVLIKTFRINFNYVFMNCMTGKRIVGYFCFHLITYELLNI